MPPARTMPQKAMSALCQVILMGLFVTLLFYSGREAYKIRLYAIKTYGRIIHEFDPWFNFRATKYLADNGWKKFFTWFDYESWYPLGRPVGTTIYPGMQITSVWIWKFLGTMDKKFQMSLNDVCVFVPAWFGVSASVFLGLLAKECSGSYAVGGLSAAIMAIVPAHLMRSVGGGYDNESIAMTAMCMTFFCWCRALRNDPSVTDGRATRDSYLWGVLAGLAYIYMVAAWGGYVFVGNMIGAHAASLFFLMRYTSKLHRAYSLFYVIGTVGAMQVPVVGWSPLKSTEQIAPLLVFCALQILEYVEVQRRKHKLSALKVFLKRVQVTVLVLLPIAAIAFVLQTQGRLSCGVCASVASWHRARPPRQPTHEQRRLDAGYDKRFTFQLTSPTSSVTQKKMVRGSLGNVALSSSTTVQGSYPLYAMPVPTLLSMDAWVPHQDLRDAGKVVEMTADMLKEKDVIFVSHQWVAFNHPDPGGEQLRALQTTITNLQPLIDSFLFTTCI